MPDEALRRARHLLRGEPDPLPRLSETAPAGYSEPFLEAVDWGLRVVESERPRSLDEWEAALAGAARPAAGVDAWSGPAPVPPARTAARCRGSGLGSVAPGVPRSAPCPFVWSLAGPRRGGGPATAWILRVAAVMLAGVAAVSWLAPPQPKEGFANVLDGGSAILAVETVPEGVEVLVGGISAGRTPLVLRTVRAGTHRVMLRHPDYESVELGSRRMTFGGGRGVTFEDGRVHRFERELVRGTGALTVMVEPGDAWIERDGERLAAGTPVTLEGLPAGTVALTLGAEGHRAARVEARVPKDGVGMLEHVLERVAHGTLTLVIEPPDAAVTLPDIASAYRAGMTLPEGWHRVVVSREGYARTTRTVEVAGDTVARIELEVVPQPFTVVTSPGDAVVKLVGHSGDYVPGAHLPPGEYHIRAMAEGYETRDERVRHGSAPTRLEVVLVRKTLAIGTTFSDALASGGRGPEMVVLPAGRVSLKGEDDEGLSVPIPQLALSKHEVKRGEFRRFMEATAHSTGDSCRTWNRRWDERRGRSWRNPDFEQTDAHPVVCVSWHDAKAYAAWLSSQTGGEYRLPYASEWVYAARAGTETTYSWGNRIGRNRANCNGCGSRWGRRADRPSGSLSGERVRPARHARERV